MTSQTSTPTRPTLADKIQEKFASQILAAVAALPDEAIKEERDITRPFVEAHMARMDVYHDHQPAYSIGPDAKASIHFTLRGEPALFQEHLSELLGEGWTGEGGTVSVGLPDTKIDEDLKAHVEQCVKQLDDALHRFGGEVHSAQGELLKLARAAYWRRVTIDRVMRNLKIPRKSSDV